MRKNIPGILLFSIGSVGLILLLVWPKIYAPAESVGPKIVATFFPVGLIAQEITRDITTVELLADPLQDPHSYAYTPDDLKALETADLIITLGVGDLEVWMQDALIIVERNIKQVALAPDLDLLKYAGGGQQHVHAELDTFTTDPHVWLDPVNVQVMAQKLTDELISLYPAHAVTLKRNLANYTAKLSALDEDLRTQLAAYQGAQFVAPHSAFAYFARRYGLQEIGSVLISPGRVPTPDEVTVLNQLITDNNIRYIYTEPETDSDFIDGLAHDLNLKIAVLDPLGTGKFEIGYYERVMLQNAQVLIQGFLAARL